MYTFYPVHWVKVTYVKVNFKMLIKINVRTAIGLSYLLLLIDITVLYVYLSMYCMLQQSVVPTAKNGLRFMVGTYQKSNKGSDHTEHRAKTGRKLSNNMQIEK